MFGGIERSLTTYQVEELSADYLLRGHFKPLGDLGVFLNDRRRDFIRLDRVELLPLTGESQLRSIHRETVNVSKQALLAISDFAAVTAHRTTVSPSVAITAPSAWRATLPVSRVSVSPPHSIDTFFTSNMWFPSPAGPYAGRGL